MILVIEIIQILIFPAIQLYCVVNVNPYTLLFLYLYFQTAVGVSSHFSGNSSPAKLTHLFVLAILTYTLLLSGALWLIKISTRLHIGYVRIWAMGLIRATAVVILQCFIYTVTLGVQATKNY